MKTAKCLYCGEEFVHNDTRARKYCSYKCVRMGNARPVKITFKNGSVEYFKNAKIAAKKLCYSVATIRLWAKCCNGRKLEYISKEEYEKAITLLVGRNISD